MGSYVKLYISLICQYIRNAWVAGSSPAGSLKQIIGFRWSVFFFGWSDFCENALTMLFLLLQFEKYTI